MSSNKKETSVFKIILRVISYIIFQALIVGLVVGIISVASNATILTTGSRIGDISLLAASFAVLVNFIVVLMFKYLITDDKSHFTREVKTIKTKKVVKNINGDENEVK